MCPDINSGSGGYIAAYGVTVAFDSVLALDSVSFDLPRGEVGALIGPNGSGKTTILNVISGRLRPTCGIIELAGKQVCGHKPHEIAALGVARTFQEVRVYRHFTAMENLLFALRSVQSETFWAALVAGRAFRRSEDALVKIAEAWLDQVRLLDMRDQLTSRLSYGQAKLLEIVRALAVGRNLVLLDEPAAGLSPQGTQLLHSLLKEAKARGTTILFIEHNMAVVREIADRVIALGSGRVIAVGSAADVIGDPVLIRAYAGDQGAANANA